MPSYRLQLLIDQQVLPIIKGAGQRITLAKPVNGSPNVIWQSIDPFVSTEISWEEQYGIYASTVAVQDGATITKMSETDIPAVDGAYYSFTAATVFSGPFGGGGVAKGSFKANNDVPYSAYPSLTFGLTQSALINQQPADRKPVSATPVLATQAATMTPFTNVYIWLQSTFKSETIITQIVGNNTIAKFGGAVTDITLKYDPNLGVFVPSTPKGVLQHDSELAVLNTNLVG